MACPLCRSEAKQIKKGFYRRRSDGIRIQKLACKSCGKTYSAQRLGIDFRLRLRDINQGVFFSLCSGISQRRTAAQFKTKPRTIARRLNRFGSICRDNLEIYRRSRPKVSHVQFDEMESFEHSKCKPLTMPIAVEETTRKILALSVGDIAAKGKLAEISVRKYGKRTCERAECLQKLMNDLKQCTRENVHIRTDQSNHYTKPIKSHFPASVHSTCKGRRGCVVGQGELKGGGFDPLFTLNHTYAMIRDNVKRLSRRTWATTKLKEKLTLFLYLYAWFHNLWLDRKVVPVILTKLIE